MLVTSFSCPLRRVAPFIPHAVHPQFPQNICSYITYMVHIDDMGALLAPMLGHTLSHSAVPLAFQLMFAHASDYMRSYSRSLSLQLILSPPHGVSTFELRQVG